MISSHVCPRFPLRSEIRYVSRRFPYVIYAVAGSDIGFDIVDHQSSMWFLPTAQTGPPHAAIAFPRHPQHLPGGTVDPPRAGPRRGEDRRLVAGARAREHL